LRVNGIDLANFTWRERIILIALAFKAPGCVSVDELISRLWADPDTEPEFAYKSVIRSVYYIRKKREFLAGWNIVTYWGMGWALEKSKE
jgi:DNA-binding SARP family transcriptional activator